VRTLSTELYLKSNHHVEDDPFKKAEDDPSFDSLLSLKVLLQPDLYRIPNANTSDLLNNNKTVLFATSTIAAVLVISWIPDYPRLSILTWRTVKSLLLVVQLSKCMAHWDDTTLSFNIMILC